jgi:hypothetical protein
MRRKRTARVHAARNIFTPGATPLWTAFAAQKVRGVAPGVMARCMPVFWPRAYRDESKPERRPEEIPITERSEP